MLQGRVSMEVIAEESSRLASDNRIRDDSNSCELLVEAYHRIRQLEAENQDLMGQLLSRRGQEHLSALEEELAFLRQALRERDLKIENLERISQKAIMDYVLLENELNALRAPPTPQRRHATPIPSELNSPLNLSKINRAQEEGQAERVTVHCAKELLKQQERLALERSQDHWRSHDFFTFDKENLHRGLKSPEAKTLKNCFSEAEVHQLIKKVHRQEEKSQDKQKLKHYHHYCSSIERKHSPNAVARKQPSQMKKLPPPLLTIKYPPPCTSTYTATCKNQRSVVSYGQKWAETATTTGSFFTGPNRLHFY